MKNNKTKPKIEIITKNNRSFIIIRRTLLKEKKYVFGGISIADKNETVIPCH